MATWSASGNSPRITEAAGAYIIEAMATLQFTAVIELRGVNPYVLVNQAQAAKLQPDWRKPLPVLVRINRQVGQPWQTNMMPTGSGDFYLYLHGGMRRSSNTGVGDTVQIELAFNDAYRTGPLHPLPTWFGDRLKQHPVAAANWEKLSPSRQKEVLRYFAGLKSVEARRRNADRALEVLGGQSERFMGRSWKSGA